MDNIHYIIYHCVSAMNKYSKGKTTQQSLTRDVILQSIFSDPKFN